MMNFSGSTIQFMLETMRQATSLVRQVQTELASRALIKDDRSPVTIADYAAQALVSFRLSQAFPADSLVAEEDTAALREPGNAEILSQVALMVGRFVPQATQDAICAWIEHNRADSGQRFWTLDPIDGTKGFLRGEQYAVALALVEEGEVTLGALGCPNLTRAYLPEPGGAGSIVIARRGQGAWHLPANGTGEAEQLLVSQQDTPAQARVLRSVESGHTNTSQVDHFGEAMGIQAAALSMDSQAKYAVLAAGQGEIYLRLISPDKPHYKEKIWDQAAGALILAEAGGTISDLDGKPLDFTTGRSLVHNRGILASNGLLHEAALNALRAVGA
jgi:3'(2'), 5'-bisphosphate nucleotidase